MRLNTKLAVLFVALAACAAGFAACYGQTNSDATSANSAPPEIQAAYGQLDSAMGQMDSAAVLKLYTPNLVYIDVARKISSRAHFAAHINAQDKASQSVICQTTIQSAVVQHSGVTVTFIRKMTITMIEPKTGILDTALIPVTARDHWIRTGGNWKINRERVLSAFVEVNVTVVKGAD